MRSWTFHSAGSLVFGRDAVSQLGDALRQHSLRRVLIVTDTILESVGIVNTVSVALSAAGIETILFRDGAPEPTLDVIEAAVALGQANRPDAVLGLGGGSNLDTAKLTAMLLKHGGAATDYVGDGRVPGPTLPMIAVPTTAGTGSEVSPAAVFTDTRNAIKVSTLSPHLRPMLAVVDPLLTISCPPKVTADSGIDALTHAIEALTAIDNDRFALPAGERTVYQGKNPMADLMAEKCIRLVGQYLVRAVQNPNDLDAREGMALAATLGGLAFSNAGVALVHAMEYPVGGAVHVSHGAGNGLLLPYVMRYNSTVRGELMATIGDWLGVPGDGIRAVEQLRAAIGIPNQLRELGVTAQMLPKFAEKAIAIGRLMRVNPRMPTEADLLAIYQAAL